MRYSQLFSLLLSALALFTTSGFTLRNARLSQNIVRSSTSLLESADKVTEIVQARVVVSGKNVQGPWYRTTVRHETVFNRKCKGSLTEHSEGTTEIIIQGPKNRVDSFVRWVKRGPGLSQIVRVDTIEFQSELSAEITSSQQPFLEKILLNNR